MKITNPLSQESLSDIFRTNPNDSTRIMKREDSTVEFKESYNHGNMATYFKTIASFANNNGGYIIFGVGDKPRTLKGLKDKSLQLFEDLKVEEFTKNLCEYFAPEIKWIHSSYQIMELTFGIIYVYPLKQKPAICKKTYDNRNENFSLKEGDIYYRYGGRSERIHYSELINIIEKNRKEEEREWLKFMMKAAKIGVVNTGLLDITHGKLIGKNTDVIIDESLLAKITFIKEGEFNEKKGKPALKLVGDIKNISLGKMISSNSPKVIQGIHQNDIITAFLKNDTVINSIEYIKQICFSPSGRLPVYFYITQSTLDIKTIINTIEEITCRGQSKVTLLERLKSDSKIIKKNEFPQIIKTTASQEKQKYSNLWATEKIPKSIQNIKYCLEAILYLSNTEIQNHEKYIRTELLVLYNKYYEKAKPTIANIFRLVLCRIDEALYRK